MPAIATLIAAYVGAYAIIEAQHERQMNRALFEQNRFMTLAASGSPGGLNAALAEYKTLKAKQVLKSPDIWRFWIWHETEAVNKEALERWAKRFFAGCPESWCGQGLDLRVLGKGDLEEADLRGANFQRILLMDVNLKSVNFSQANLQSANLSEANLESADLSQANLQATDLRGTRLNRTNLSQANLQGADLRGANLEQANLEQANLEQANLWRANFEQALLIETNLRSAFLAQVILDRAELSRANFQGADLRGSSFEYTHFEGTNLQDANLWHTNFQSAALWETNLEHADLMLANLEHADLRLAKLQYARNLLSARAHTAFWDETTRWPDNFIPLCPRHFPVEPCEFLDLLAADRLLLPALDRFLQILRDRIPERSSGIAGMIDDVIRQAPIR